MHRATTASTKLRLIILHHRSNVIVVLKKAICVSALSPDVMSAYQSLPAEQFPGSSLSQDLTGASSLSQAYAGGASPYYPQTPQSSYSSYPYYPMYPNVGYPPSTASGWGPIGRLISNLLFVGRYFLRRLLFIPISILIYLKNLIYSILFPSPWGMYSRTGAGANSYSAVNTGAVQ